MGLTKADKFTKSQNDLAALAKALGHPARIAIIEHLLETKACVCGGFVDEIGLAQATISQHLKELKHSGLIKGNIEGTSMCYCIDEKNWEKAASTIGRLFQKFTSQDCC